MHRSGRDAIILVQFAYNHTDEDDNYDIAADMQEFIMEHLQQDPIDRYGYHAPSFQKWVQNQVASVSPQISRFRRESAFFRETTHHFRQPLGPLRKLRSQESAAEMYLGSYDALVCRSRIGGPTDQTSLWMTLADFHSPPPLRPSESNSAYYSGSKLYRI
jgi:hypothetical protein